MANFTEKELLQIKHMNLAAKSILSIYPFIWTFLSIGNILSLIVFLQKDMRKSHTNTYLAVLAVFDFLFINTSSWANMQDAVEGGRFAGNIRYIAKQKLYQFILHTCNSMAGWLLVLISFDRLFMLYQPLKSKLYATPRHAIIIMLVTCTPFIIYHTHTLYGFDGLEFYRIGNASIDSNIRIVEKYTTVEYKNFYTGVHLIFIGPILNTIFFIPVVINNILIIYKVRQRILERKVDLGVKEEKIDASSIKITKMLVVVSILAIILRAPLVIVNPIAIKRFMRREYDLWWLSYYFLFFVVGYALIYLNSCVNFFVYITLSSKFKKTFIGIFCPKKFQKDRKSDKNKLEKEKSGSTETSLANTSTEISNISIVENRI